MPHAIREIGDSNFELCMRIPDDSAFGAAVKDFLFEQYRRARRPAEKLIKRGEALALD